MTEKTIKSNPIAKVLSGVTGGGKSQALRRLEYLNSKRLYKASIPIAGEIKAQESASRSELTAVYECEIHNGFLEEARETAFRLFEMADSLAEEAQSSNDIAWADLLMYTGNHHPYLVEEGDNYSASACSVITHNPDFSATRALAMIYKGEPDDGIDFASETLKLQLTKAQKANVSCVLALAQAQKGNQDKARELIDAAKFLDPKCLLLRAITGSFS